MKKVYQIFTKTKSIKKQVLQFEEYKKFIIEKKYKSYGGGIDTIIGINGNGLYNVEYIVKDKDGKIRTHGTWIKTSDILKNEI